MLNTRLSHFFHPVKNIQLALRFFRDILGLKLVYSNLTETTEEMVSSVDISKVNWLEFDAGNFTLIVQQVPDIQPYDTGIGFSVDNCDEAFVYFRNNDIQVTSQIQGIQGRVRTFEIKDFDGNTFNIFGA